MKPLLPLQGCLPRLRRMSPKEKVHRTGYGPRKSLQGVSHGGICLGVLVSFAASVSAQQSATPGMAASGEWINRILTGDPTRFSSATATWNVSFTTRESFAPPEGLHDYANVHEPSLLEVTASTDSVQNVSHEAPLWDDEVFLDHEGKRLAHFWTALVPATMTLVFASPFVLEKVDLTSPTRRGGFSDFKVLVRKRHEEERAVPRILEATVAVDGTVLEKFLWRLTFEPVEVEELTLTFYRGTVFLPRQVFLEDLDIWGRPPD